MKVECPEGESCGLTKDVISLGEVSLHDSFNDKAFSDFTVVSSDDVSFYLHRVVLTQIPYFHGLFRTTLKESKNQITKLDIRGKELEMILRFAYFLPTLTDLSVEQILELLRDSSSLMYKSFIIHLWRLLREAVNDDYVEINFSDVELVLKIARDYNLKPPAWFNLDEIVTHQTISADDVILLLDSFHCKTPIIAKWISSHPDDEEGHRKMIELIDIDTLSKTDMEIFFEIRIKTKTFLEFLVRFAYHQMYAVEEKTSIKKPKLKPFDPVKYKAANEKKKEPAKHEKKTKPDTKCEDKAPETSDEEYICSLKRPEKEKEPARKTCINCSNTATVSLECGHERCTLCARVRRGCSKCDVSEDE